MILIFSGAYTWYFKDIARHAAQPVGEHDEFMQRSE